MTKLDEKKGEHVERKIGANEELDTTKLSDLRSAIAGLKIVDVSRKPKALAEALKQGLAFGNDPASKSALRQKGFIADTRAKPIRVVGEQGDAVIGLETGIEYVVRFGQVADLSDAEPADDKKQGDDKDKQQETAGLNRHCYVTAQVNVDLIPKPEIEELPKLEDFLPKPEPPAKGDDKKEEDGKKDEEKKDDKKIEDKKNDEKKDDEVKGDEKKEEEKEEEVKDEAKKEDGAGLPTTGNSATLTQADGDDKAEKPADEKAADKDDEKTEDKDAEGEDAEDKEPEGKEPEDEGSEDRAAPKVEEPKKKTPEEEAQEKLEVELARVEADNKRKQAEFEEKIKDAREKVGNINARFADWFYVISESEYKKIHLSSDDLIKKKAPPTGGAGGLPPGHPPAGQFQLPGGGLPQFPGTP